MYSRELFYISKVVVVDAVGTIALDYHMVSYTAETNKRILMHLRYRLPTQWILRQTDAFILLYGLVRIRCGRSHETFSSSASQEFSSSAAQQLGTSAAQELRSSAAQ